MSKTIQAVRGMNDVLPAEVHWWQRLESVVRGWLGAYGYREIRMPILERTELFVRSIGEVTDVVEKEMYTFFDARSEESLTLRPEGTASCVRAVIEHKLLHDGPQRLWYGGAMFRHERPQKGRYRQFDQFGVEALGFAGPDVDVEHMVMCARLWRMLGLAGIELEVNTLGSAETRARYRAQLVEYLEGRHAELDVDSKRRLTTNPLRVLDSKNPAMREVIAGAPRLLDHLDPESGAHFEAVQAGLTAAGVVFRVNPRLVRGLDYYNRTVFEWTTTRLGAQGTVCAGGRYDGLVESVGGKAAAACGYAMGVDRLLELMKADSVVEAPAPDVYLVRQGVRAERYGEALAERLRDAGVSVALHCGGGSFKSQMRKADASGAHFAVIVGDNEADAQELTLKSLREDAPQARVTLDEALTRVRTRV